MTIVNMYKIAMVTLQHSPDKTYKACIVLDAIQFQNVFSSSSFDTIFLIHKIIVKYRGKV